MHIYMRLIVFCVLWICILPVRAAQPDPSGIWVGRWERDGSTLDVEVVIARSGPGYTGTFSSAQLRVVGIPFENIRYDAPRISWSLVGDATTSLFDGTLQDNMLTGRFREGDAVGTFRLTRGAPATAVIQEQEIGFRNGTVRLSGSVIWPMGMGPFPGIVLLHGSGPEGRWASRYLATEFARNGIAVLIYDKRGVGASTGDWRRAGFAELVSDASAAVEALRTWPGIDPAMVGIHGHSQGGTISPWVASENPHVAFVIGSAASGVSMTELETYSLGNAIGVSHIPESNRPQAERFIEAIVVTAYNDSPRKQLESVWQAVRDQPWAFKPPPESDPYWTFSRLTAAYDPLDYWRRVTVPTLLIYGEDDERVPVRKSAARIADAYLAGEGAQLDVRILPDADHTFRLQFRTSDNFEWPKSASGYPEAIIQWILGITHAGGA